MLAKNRPTKRVQLPENNWVELRHLSKGQKDSLASELADLYAGMKFEEDANGQPKPDSIPPGMLDKINQVNYRKIVMAVASWSVPDGVTLENVQALDEEYYDLILEAVNEMTNLTKDEAKN